MVVPLRQRQSKNIQSGQSQHAEFTGANLQSLGPCCAQRRNFIVHLRYYHYGRLEIIQLLDAPLNERSVLVQLLANRLKIKLWLRFHFRKASFLPGKYQEGRATVPAEMDIDRPAEMSPCSARVDARNGLRFIYS